MYCVAFYYKKMVIALDSYAWETLERAKQQLDGMKEDPQFGDWELKIVECTVDSSECPNGVIKEVKE